MTYRIEIKTDNAAFEDDPGYEVARILRKLADRVESEGLDQVRLMDINGNCVGSVEVEDSE